MLLCVVVLLVFTVCLLVFTAIMFTLFDRVLRACVRCCFV